jgi:hypothetical protein
MAVSDKNPHGAAYRGGPIPGHDKDVAEKRFKRAGERRAEKERQRQYAKERYAREAAEVQRRADQRRAEMEAAMAREARWHRIDAWHAQLDAGHAALDFGNADPALRPFFDHHYRARRPVVFAAGHFEQPPAMLWTFDALMRHWGEVKVEVQNRREDPTTYEIGSHTHKAQAKFGEFLSAALRGQHNRVYMTANNAGANRELLHLMRHHLSPLPGVLTGEPTQGFLWMGRGSFTPIHHDLTNNLMFQLVGTKRVTLYPPQMHRLLMNERHVYSKYPRMDAATARFNRVQHEEVILRPGEALFIPVGWWHMVEALVAPVKIEPVPMAMAGYQARMAQVMQSNNVFWHEPDDYSELPPTTDYGPDSLNVTYSSFMFPWDNHSWHAPFPA